MRWVVDRIHVLAPICFTHIRRNEISSKISARNVRTVMNEGSGPLRINVAAQRQQRAAMILKDVQYGIEAHVEILEETQGLQHPEAKHLEMFKRRASRGQYFHHPYFGCREFPVDFELVESFPDCPDVLCGKRDLGFMLQDMVFVPDPKGKVIESSRGRRVTAEPHFFRPTMEDGVIEVPPLEKARG